MRRPRLALAPTLALALVLGGCSAAGTAPPGSDAAGTASGTSAGGGTADATSSTFFDTSSVHTLAVQLDDDAYSDALAAYLDTGGKVWLQVTVTIDGETFTDVGMRLKGNSTLRVITADSRAQDLPWLIRLDKYVDGQSLDGVTSFVVRASSTRTAVNEAVALELIAAAGLASQDPTEVAFSVNGGEATLRLVIENPDDAWAARTFGADWDGQLYKAESGGDYTYRGDDPAAYDDVFDQEAGDPETLEPLTDFLQWLNASDDAAFAAELADHVDVDALVTYLAVQEVVGNFDDIDGPGNNSYLEYDPATGLMTVVSWDQNLSFGTANVDGGGGGGAGMPGGQAGGAQRPGGGPAGGGAPGGQGGGAQGGPGGGMSSGNVLTERFLADSSNAALVEAEVTRLRAELVASGLAADLLEAWQTTLASTDLVDTATVTQELEAVREALAG